tara:strand:- start:132 stop:1265 length:1134 start_codon:yes stop_codon:yes gene_type:complete
MNFKPKNIAFAILCYFIIFIIPFAFLKTFPFQDWSYLPFVQSVIGTFMGAGTIAILTASLLVFQKKLDSEHKRNQEVFTNRVAFYKNTVTLLSNIISDRKVDEEELRKIKAIYLELILIADQNIQIKYLELQESLKTADLEDNAELQSIYNITTELIELMSDSLGFGKVHKATIEEQSKLKALQENIISSGNEIEEVLSDKTNPKNKFLEWIEEVIAKNDLIVDEDGKKLSKTGGLSYYKNKKKFLQIGFQGNRCEILTLRIPVKNNDFKQYDYVIPETLGRLEFNDIREYSPKKSPSYKLPWGYSFFKIRFSYSELASSDKDFLEKLICAGNKYSDERLKLSSKDHKRLSTIFTKGDEATASPWSYNQIANILKNN